MHRVLQITCMTQIHHVNLNKVNVAYEEIQQNFSTCLPNAGDS